MPAVDGIVSGFNTTQIINQVLAASRGPIRQLQNQQAEVSARQSAFQELNTLLTTLQTSVEGADTDAEFAEFTATSAQSSAVGVTVTGAPTPASHIINVTQVAQASLVASNSIATSSTALANGTLDITVGSTTTTINLDGVDNTDDLDGLAAYINENVDGVQAWVLDNGSGYQLMVQGEETGAANAVTLSASQSGAGEMLSFSTAVTAQNAMLTIDSVAVTSASNTIVDALPGLTLEVKDLTTGNNRVTVTRDSTSMQSTVQEIVDAYNAVVEFINNQQGIGDSEPGVLSGDSALNSVRSRLSSVITSSFTTGDLAGLRSVGIELANDGTLTFDTTEFSTALGTDYSDLVQMMTDEDDGFLPQLRDAVDLLADPTTGLIQSRIDNMDDQIADFETRIEDAETRLDTMEETLRSQFTQLEVIMARYQAIGDFLTQQTAQLNRQSSGN